MGHIHGHFEKTSKQLIDDIVTSGAHVAPGAVQSAEMMRRQIDAIEKFSKEASRQTSTLIWLTVAIAILTIPLVIDAGIKLWAHFGGSAVQ